MQMQRLMLMLREYQTYFGYKTYNFLRFGYKERVCCLLVLNSVTSTLQKVDTFFFLTYFFGVSEPRGVVMRCRV